MRRQRIQRYLRALDELIEIGMDSTRLVQSQAKAETATRLGEPAPDFTIATERIYRTVRRTMLLSQKLAQPVKAVAPASQGRVAARQRIIRGVEDFIERDAPADAVDSLHAKFAERLDSPELADDVDQRLAEDIITEIAGTLGLPRPLARAGGSGGRHRMWRGYAPGRQRPVRLPGRSCCRCRRGLGAMTIRFVRRVSWEKNTFVDFESPLNAPHALHRYPRSG